MAIRTIRVEISCMTRGMTMTPMGTSSRRSGVVSIVRVGDIKVSQAFLRLREFSLGRRQQVLDVDRFTIKHRASGDVTQGYRDGPADRRRRR